MQYGLGVWGSMTSKSQINEIYTLQKKCIRLLSKDKATLKDHLFKRHRIIRFPDMIQIELCKLGFKLAKKNLPELLQVLMESRGGKKFHMNNTQSKHVPNIHKHNSIHYNTSFLCRSVMEYSKLPKNLTTQPNI